MSKILSTDRAEAVQECTDVLRQNPHSIKKWLNLLDKYMQSFADDPQSFLLPKAHAHLEPVVQTYAFNTEGFALYLLEIRDSFSKEDKSWEHAQSLYRKVNSRYTMQARRERSGRATTKAEELYGPTDYHSRLQWVADVEHRWAQRRLAFLDAYRDKYKSPRLDTETRAEVLAEFWDMIDTEILEGKELPPWN